MSIVIWMSLNALRMVFERSCRMLRCTDGGSCASSVGQHGAHGVGHLDDVGARLLLHLQRDDALLRPAFV